MSRWFVILLTTIAASAPARAIVIENGGVTAALVTLDAGAVPTPIWETVTRQVEAELKIPVANVLLTATHTHSAGGQRGPDYAQKIVESIPWLRRDSSSRGGGRSRHATSRKST